MSDTPRTTTPLDLPTGPLTTEEEEALMARYMAAGHAIQSGVNFLINRGGTLATAKHLRVGLDLRASDHRGLVTLLIAKGVITDAEYRTAMTWAAEEERAELEARVSRAMGTSVTLA